MCSKERKKVYLLKKNNQTCWGRVNGVWSVLCWLKRLMRCVFARRRGDNDALYGRGGVVRPRGCHNDTPQISLSGLLIGHGHLPLHPHTQTHTHTHTHTHTITDTKPEKMNLSLAYRNITHTKTHSYTYPFQVNKPGDFSQHARYGALWLHSQPPTHTHIHTHLNKHIGESDTLHIRNALAHTHTATPQGMDTHTHTHLYTL